LGTIVPIGLSFFHKKMKYSLKYRILLVYWKVFSKEKYMIAQKFRRAFKTMSKEDKDLLIKAGLKGVKEYEVS
jgi:hypothetical protein